MQKVTRSLLKKAAHNIMLDMTEEQYALLEAEFTILLAQMDLIGHIVGIDDVAPMTFPFDETTEWMREDIPSSPTSAADILKNAGFVEDHQIKVPKVVG
ncbi:MAG: Asp-tRNA(Asn)/Glu-tRNA(Gln) amidotransferase subunit GatC [Bacilli bacterium]|jgi:aspartyl/glutamyl-tRNA(Asn/Gln) amidotransferase C subunit